MGPDGYHARREFGAGEPVQVSLLAADGSPLQNGRYRYTLQVSPRPAELPARQVGIFFVGDGDVSRRAKRAELANLRSGLDRARKSSGVQARVSRELELMPSLPLAVAAIRHRVGAPNSQGMVAPDYLTIDGSPYSPTTVHFSEYGYADVGVLYQDKYGNLYRYTVENNFDFGATNRRVGSVANRDYARNQLREKDTSIHRLWPLQPTASPCMNYEGAFVINQSMVIYGNYMPDTAAVLQLPLQLSGPCPSDWLSGYQYVGATDRQLDGGRDQPLEPWSTPRPTSSIPRSGCMSLPSGVGP